MRIDGSAFPINWTKVGIVTIEWIAQAQASIWFSAKGWPIPTSHSQPRHFKEVSEIDTRPKKGNQLPVQNRLTPKTQDQS